MKATLAQRRKSAAKALTGRVRGEIRFDPFTCALYSTDASIYQIEPVGVVFPMDAEDVHATVSACSDLGIAILARGGGTSLAGQAVGEAVHIDFSRFCNKVLEINPEEKWVRVQPGVVLDRLNASLAGQGLMFGPDVSPSNRATLGGMIGNNACGTRSIVYGKTVDHVLALRVVLADGRRATLGPRGSSHGVPAEVQSEVERIRADEADEIRLRFPRIMRRVSGYNLDAMLSEEPNLAHLIVGSEGTLAVIEEARLRLVDRPPHNGLLLVHCRDIEEALAANLVAIENGPSACELLERMLLEMARGSVEYGRYLWFLEGDPHEILVIEFSGESVEEVESKLDRIEDQLRRKRIGASMSRAMEAERKQHVWKIRTAGLPLLMAVPGDRKPVAFVEDTAVAPEQLPGFIKRFQEIVAAHQTIAAFYAHTSVGCMHIRPLLNLKDANDVRRMREMAEEVFALVREYGGCLSGEHGDGLARSMFNERMFGPRLYQAFRRLKRAFDPRSLMNPGKIVDAPDMTENLRRGVTQSVQPHLDFRHLGGFTYTVEQCNGTGMCRKTDTGTMCPSYMVTLDEQHSTRGRANAFRGVLGGWLSGSGLSDPRMREIMDLCIACKACKSECPSRVDMAALKFEFLTHWYERHRVPLRTRLFSRAALLGKAGTLFPSISNAVLSSRPVRWLLDRVLGIDACRSLPRFAWRRFTSQVRAFRPESVITLVSGHKEARGNASFRVSLDDAVILFPDTFVEYHAPQIGLAMLRVMEATGRRVLVSAPICCGRPMISMGLRELATEHARDLTEMLRDFARHGCDVVVSEPSCISAVRDDYRLLLSTEMLGDVAEHVFMLCEWLVRLAEQGKLPPRLFRPFPARVLLHGHCHQKALTGIEPTVRALRMVPELEVEVSDAGCCGMAGAFGYEKEHYEISVQMGERRLLPAAREFLRDRDGVPRFIVAPGASCRQQIAHGTGVRALHPAQILARALSGAKLDG